MRSSRVNADSIVIPLFNTALASVLVLPFLLVWFAAAAWKRVVPMMSGR